MVTQCKVQADNWFNGEITFYSFPESVIGNNHSHLVVAKRIGSSNLDRIGSIGNSVSQPFLTAHFHRDVCPSNPYSSAIVSAIYCCSINSHS